MNKKEFGLSQIKPYFLNPDLCGYDKESENCQYLTPEGKMCVLGKNLIDPSEFGVINAGDLLTEQGEQVLKEESRGILTPEEWEWLQNLHDKIAKRGRITELSFDPNYTQAFFTLQELKDYEM